MVWIDTDMGFDDIAAILMVDRSELRIAGASLVFGNAALARVRQNAASAAAFFGWAFPIHSGADQPIVEETITAANVLGKTGMPTRGRQFPDAQPIEVGPALAGLATHLETVTSPSEVLALGPLTNIALLLLTRPDLSTKISRLTWMGGGAGPGNHTASAEFNAFADPEALAIVLRTGIPFRMVELDLCRTVTVGPEDVDRLAETGTDRAALLADLLGGYVDIALERGRPAMALYDPVAAAAIIDSDAVSFAPARIDVELGGTHCRGRTIVDRRPRAAFNAEIGVLADAGRVRKNLLDALAGAAA